MDTFPVTRREFLHVVLDCRLASQSAAHQIDMDFWAHFDREHKYDDQAPIVAVSFEEASWFAWIFGGRLPTLAEWNRAARGDANNSYPWGLQFDPTLCNFSDSPFSTGPDIIDHLTNVDEYPGGASQFGVMDCLGNCREWTMTPAVPIDFINASKIEDRRIAASLWTANISEVYVKNVGLNSHDRRIGSTVTAKRFNRHTPFLPSTFAGATARDFRNGFRVAYDASRLDEDSVNLMQQVWK